MRSQNATVDTRTRLGPPHTSSSNAMVVVNFTRLVVLVSACVGVASFAVASTLQLHEVRKGIPAGFSLHGAASPDTVLNLGMALVQSNFAGLEERLYDVSTPSSANYGKHLSKAEVSRYPFGTVAHDYCYDY